MYRHIDWIIDTAEFAVPAALRDDTVEQNGTVKDRKGRRVDGAPGGWLRIWLWAVIRPRRERWLRWRCG
jgi:hypothetical protein